MPDQYDPVETAAAILPGDAAAGAAVNELLGAFEAFKHANDARLAEIERRGSADVLLEEKVDRISAALDRQQRAVDDLTLGAGRPDLAAEDTASSRETREHKAAFEDYVRRGVTPSGAGEVKAMRVGADADGGYLAPEETDREVGRLLADYSPIRAIATVRRISAGTFRKPFVTSGVTSGWIGETDTPGQSTTPTLAELEYSAAEIYAMPAATQTLLDDAAVDIGEWLAGEIQTVFAEQESKAFITGDGMNKPRGFLSVDTVDDASWAWGKVGYHASGVDGDFADSNPMDGLIDLVYALKAGYRGNARWVMNRNTQAKIRKFKDTDGNYIWQPGQNAGAPSTLLTFPVTEAEHMPDIASDAFALAFGDFRHGYLVVDRVGLRVLRDPYSSKPYVLFYTTRRVGGGVQNFEAIKLMKFGAS